MASLSLVGLSIKGATTKASQETFKNITNALCKSIVASIKERLRGAGNIKGEDIKITENKAIEFYVKRINADLRILTGYDHGPETKKITLTEQKLTAAV